MNDIEYHQKKRQLVDKTRQVASAITFLASRNITILAVDFRASSPLIICQNSGALGGFVSGLKAQLCKDGIKYRVRATVLNGCEINWSEPCPTKH